MIKISIYKKQREQIKNTIIQTAVDLFREKGYENVSVDEITKKIEIAKGTFYNYFKSKGDLLSYWSAECFSKIDVQGAMDKTKSTEENLRYLLESFVITIKEERLLFITFIKEMGTMNLTQTESKKDFDFTGLLKAVISNSCDSTGILANKFEIKIQVLNSVIYNAIVSWICSDMDLNGIGEYIVDILKICLYGLFEKGECKND